MKSLISVTVVLLLLSATASPAKASSDMPAVTSENKIPQERGATPSPLHHDRHGVRQSRTTALRRVTDGMHTPRKPQLALAVFRVAPPSEYRPMETLKEIVIDVIVAFTGKAANSYSDIRRELIDHAIEVANESFRVSNLGHIRLNLAHTYATDYIEEGSHFDHLWRFADKGDGYMEEVHSLRDRYRADVAVLIVHDPRGCGLATRVRADADEAFAVVHHECAAANYTLAHEIGHLIGATHDLSYVNGTKWRDIMGVKERCGGCPRLPVWSSPTVLVDDEPAGTADHDNARVIAEQAGRVAAFR